MIGLIADIHGNLHALRAVLRRMESLGVSTIYSLGDVAGYYPLINECIDLLREKGIQNLMGNHDHYLVNGVSCGRSETVDRLIALQRAVITKDNIRWLKASGRHFDLPAFFAVHGGMHDPLDEYVTDFQFPEGIPQRHFFTAHTHRQMCMTQGGLTHANPGSAGQPRDGDPRAAFALLLPDGSVRLMRTKYAVEEAAAAMKRAGYEERLYRGLYSGDPIAPAARSRAEREEGL